MMFSRRNAVALLWLSVLLPVVAWGQSRQEWSERSDKITSKAAYERFLDGYQISVVDGDWVAEVKISLKNNGLETAKREFLSGLNAREIAAGTEPSGELSDPNEEVRRILSNPAYRDGGTTDSNNWLVNAASAVGEAVARALADILSRFRPPDLSLGAPNLGAGAVAARLFMILLGLALVAFLGYFIVKMSRGRRLRRKKAGGMLDDDEPDRTADEWLAQADLLTSQGKLREAVRCLYIACLVRFDDAGVAHFDRGQTNWEHLYRIQASVKKPAGMDFREPTKAFDQFWYGYAPINEDDVAGFRRLYDDLLTQLGMRGAAA